jgi:hypothetical protein
VAYTFVRHSDAPLNIPASPAYIIHALDLNSLQIAIEAETAGIANVRESQYAGGAAANGTTDDYPVLHAADLAAIGMTYIGPGSYRVSSSLTITQPTYVADGAQLLPDSGVTVTFAVMPRLPDAYCFAGFGICTFAAGVASHLKSIWWSAGVPGGATAALAALASASLEYTAGNLVPQHLSLTSRVDGGATPNGSASNILLLANASPTMVTGFTGGSTGAFLTLLFQDGNTTLVNSATLVLADYANLTGVAGSSLTLLFSAGIWWELSRTGPTTTSAALPVTPTLTGTPYAGPGLGGNLVQNGDFSNGSVGWVLTAQASIDTNQADAPPSSDTCLKMVTTAIYQSMYGASFPVLPNTMYTIGGYVRADGANNGYIIPFGFKNADCSDANPLILVEAYTLNASWTFVSASFTTPGWCKMIKVALDCQAASTYYYGRIGLVQGSTYTDAMFASNPLGNRSLVTCEATTNLLNDGDCEGVGGSATAPMFNDPLADVTAWTNISGTVSVASNVLTLTDGVSASVGHPDWWDTQGSVGVSASQVRFQSQVGWKEYDLFLTYVDSNNHIYVALLPGSPASMSVYKRIAGVLYLVGNGNVTLTDGTVYWFTWTRSGTGLTASVCADGAVPGAVAGTLTVTIADTALQAGRLAFQAIGAALLLGQMGSTAYSNIFQVSGARPSAWAAIFSAGTPAFCWSKAQSFSGTYSLSVYTNDSGSSGYWNQTVTIINGDKYVPSCRVYAASGNPKWAFYGSPYTPTYGQGTTTSWQPLSEVDTVIATSTNVAALLQAGVAGGLVYFDCMGYEQKAYPTLNLSPFPAFYVPTGTRTAKYASIPVPPGFVGARPWTMRFTAKFAGDVTKITLYSPLLTMVGAAPAWAVGADGFGMYVLYNTSYSSSLAFLAGTTVNTVTVYGVLTFDGFSTFSVYGGGALHGTFQSNPQIGSSLQLGNGECGWSLSGLVIANHAWSAAEVAGDYANPNPPGLISGGGLYLLPGMLYAQAPDASAGSLGVAPAVPGRSVSDIVRVGLLETAAIRSLAPSGYLSLNGMGLDQNGLMLLGGLKRLPGQSIGTTQTTVAHGLGRVPGIALVQPHSNAVVSMSAPADATNTYWIASTAATADIYVA